MGLESKKYTYYRASVIMDYNNTEVVHGYTVDGSCRWLYTLYCRSNIKTKEEGNWDKELIMKVKKKDRMSRMTHHYECNG